MIHRLPVIGAFLATITVLGLALLALLSRLPPTLEEGNGLVMTVRMAKQAAPLVNPALMTVLILVLALAGLTVLFVLEFLKPKAQRKASQRRLRATEDVLRALDDATS